MYLPHDQDPSFPFTGKIVKVLPVELRAKPANITSLGVTLPK
jgi:hypothetical protein